MLSQNRLADDPHRPQYHFLPPANWMNDPNGLIHWQGQYHLFYQHNPHSPTHQKIHWGHAISDDLVHWKDLPLALAPSPDGHDAEGCWSGCAIDNNGTPTLFYTGAFPQVQLMATSTDGLLTWQKHAANPVISHPPDELRRSCGGHIRDPFVWRDGDAWMMILGSKIDEVGGMILLYRSEDLINWEYLHPLMVGDVHQKDPIWLGTMWECPNLLDFGEKQGLIFSTQATPSDLMFPVAFTGTYQNHRFTPERQAKLAHGGYFYAPQAMQDENGRYLLWGWVQEGRSQRISEWAGWAGVQSLPLEVTLSDEGDVCLNPAPELQILRQNHQRFEQIDLHEGIIDLLKGVANDCLEIIAEFEFERFAKFGLLLRCSPDMQEQTRLIVRSATHEIALDRANSSVGPGIETDERTAPIELATPNHVRLHIFVDRSVVEVFVENGRTYFVSRIYPLRPDSLGIGLFCTSGRATLKSMDIWEMKSIWS
jgi:beta-fructofuranosidase